VGRSDASIATVNSGNATTFNLTALKKFVVYHIQMLAYTAVGDGATSLPALSVRTFEDGTPAFFCVLSIVRACHLCFYMVCMEGFVTSQFAVNLVACCVLVNLLFNLLISLNNNSKLKRRMQHFLFCFVYFSFERKFCTIVTIINRFVQCSKVLNLEVLDTSEVLYRSVQTI